MVAPRNNDLVCRKCKRQTKEFHGKRYCMRCNYIRPKEASRDANQLFFKNKHPRRQDAQSNYERKIVRGDKTADAAATQYADSVALRVELAEKRTSIEEGLFLDEVLDRWITHNSPKAVDILNLNKEREVVSEVGQMSIWGVTVLLENIEFQEQKKKRRVKSKAYLSRKT